MSWNNLVSLDYLNFKSLSWRVCNSKHNNSTFDFIKILKQIINHFSKAHDKIYIFLNLCQNSKGTTIM
jgi:hypothetical protein